MKPLFKGAPPEAPTDIVAWAEENVRLIGSVRSERYDRNITPWTIEPIQRLADMTTKIVTLVKPVQSGGSRVGLIALAWFARFGYGQIQYNWEKDEKAADKWKKETLPTLEACRDLRWGDNRFDVVNCYAKFQRTAITAQGVWIPENLDSDSIPYQVNEEVHSWKPGHLSKARGRQTAVWFPKAVDISNAGTVGDQLHQAQMEGTDQVWTVKCPGCGLFHPMRTRWEDSKPELGGLRYDSEGCKLEGGRFDYNKLETTIRYQMPCGYLVRDNKIERRALSQSGKYSEPRNAGAHISHRSYSYEAVAVDFIPWIQLIQEKHIALRSRKAGDNDAWMRYITERECQFYSVDSLPYSGAIYLTSGIKKSRTGIDNEAARIWAADWQQGYKSRSELTHYWTLIESVDKDCNSKVIFEGIVDTDDELIRTLADHGITPESGIADGAIDASKNTKQILSFCYRAGINAVMGNASGKGAWKFEDESYRYYSPPKYIYKELNMPNRYEPIMTRDGWKEHPDEPFIIMYNKAGLLKNHFFIREMKTNVLDAAKQDGREVTPYDYIERIIPGDVSEDYKKHHEEWERDFSATGPKKMGAVEGFKPRRDPPIDHLMSCSCYVDMFKDMSGLLGNRLGRLGMKEIKP